MKALYGTALCGIAIAAVAFYAGMNAVQKPSNMNGNAALFDPANTEFTDAVKTVLFSNPEMIEQAQTMLAEQRAREEDEQRRVVLASLGEQMEDPALPVLGDRNAPITIVEFFDYNCGFCRRALEDVEAVLATTDDVKFVLKEFPILGPPSLEAHQVSAAVQSIKPEAYQEFHHRLLSYEGRADNAAATTVALSLGISEEALRTEMAKPNANQLFSDSYSLAEQLSITGTPSYIIGNEVVFGLQSAEEMLARIEQIRENAAN